jgi:hypothetical protein
MLYLVQAAILLVGIAAGCVLGFYATINRISREVTKRLGVESSATMARLLSGRPVTMDEMARLAIRVRATR